MTITSEQSLCNFEFWSGACDRVKHLTAGQLQVIENILIDDYPDGITDTELNDIFWFEEDTLADWLGFQSWEELEVAESLGLDADELDELKNDFINLDDEDDEAIAIFKEENELTDKQYSLLNDIC